MSMRQKLGFRKENIITIFSFVLFVSVVVYAITHRDKIDYIQTSISLATLLSVLFSGQQLKIQLDEFKKSVAIQEKREKENEEKELKNKMESSLYYIIDNILYYPETKKDLKDNFMKNRLFFLRSAYITLRDHDYESVSSPFRNTGRDLYEDNKKDSENYLNLEKQFKEKFGEDKEHAKIAKILKEKVPALI